MRLVSTFAFLPIMGISGLMVNIPPAQPNITIASQTAYLQKLNTKAQGFLALNQEVDLKVKIQQLKADAINVYFSAHDMPLESTGMKMVQEAEKNDLDWRLLPAIAMRESTGGKFACIRVNNNPFGWGSCKIGFDSLDGAIETVARNLGGNNPKTAQYYANKNTMQILRAYNPPSVVLRYAEQVMKIMNDIGDENLVVPVVM